MATWFAQNSSVNIDSANQWNSAANGSGSWLTWASLDAADVLVANGKTSITINVDTTCSTMTNIATGGTAGGGFILSASITVAANITCTSTCFVFSNSGNSYIVGNITGGTVGYGLSAALSSTGTGSISVTGNIIGGSGYRNHYSHGIRSTGGGTVTVIGSVTGLSYHGIYANSGTVTVTGTVTGGNFGSPNWTPGEGSNTSIFGCGISIEGNATLSVTGDVTGGTANGATYSTPGIFSASSIPMTIVGTVTGSSNNPSIVQNINTLCTIHGNIVAGVNGHSVAVNRLLIHASSVTTHTYRVNSVGSPVGVARSLYTGGTNLGQPVIADVREATVFGASSEYTGTLAVPSPTLVAIGVNTDNTVGSYAPSSGLDAAGVRAAVGLATANLDTQLAAIVTDTNEIQLGMPTSGFLAGAVDAAGAAVLDSATQAQIDAIEDDTNDLQTNQGAWATATGFATPTNITAGTITTCTNLTNLPAGVQTSIDTVQAIAAGTVSGAGTDTEVFVGTNATVTVTADSSGNRSAVVVT